MSIIDIIILVVVAFGLIRGLMNGLVQELTILVALVLGVIGAKMWSPELGQRISEAFTWSEKVSAAVAYAAILFGITVGLGLIGKLLTRILRAASLSGLNRLMGGLFGALKWAIIVGALLTVIDMFNDKVPIIKQEAKEQSVLYQPIQSLFGVAWDEVME